MTKFKLADIKVGDEVVFEVADLTLTYIVAEEDNLKIGQVTKEYLNTYAIYERNLIKVTRQQITIYER